MDVNVAGSITQRIRVEDTSQVGQARRAAQQLAEGAKFGITDAGRVALVATELATNLLKHAAEGGELHLSVVPGLRPGIELIAIDRGPGFQLEACLADGFSTGGTQGIGLGAVSRQAQVFDAYSDTRGSAVLARVYAGSATGEDIRFGASQHSLRDDPACGDAWQLAFDGKRLSAMVIDGLGHGPEAEQAALAGAKRFANDPYLDPSELLSVMHRAMSGTRGAAAAVAQFDQVSGALHFSGIGNIAASIVTPITSRGMASHPGILGVQFRKAQTFHYPNAAGQILILHSDGLQSRWSLQSYAGLWHRHPAIIAAVLYRDFSRGNDDATVLVVALDQRSV